MASTRSTVCPRSWRAIKTDLAIPLMYERLKTTFTKMNIDFEIIFVDDCRPDNSGGDHPVHFGK